MSKLPASNNNPLSQYFIKKPSRYALVDQVAKSPYEVLANTNKKLLAVIADYDVADTLITVIRGVDEYSKFFRVDLKHVRIVEVEPLNRGLGITYSHEIASGPDVLFKKGTLDFMISSNEKAARWCMDIPNMDGLMRVLYAMHYLARQNNLTILDIGIEGAPIWPKGRNDHLFLGF